MINYMRVVCERNGIAYEKYRSYYKKYTDTMRNLSEEERLQVYLDHINNKKVSFNELCRQNSLDPNTVRSWLITHDCKKYTNEEKVNLYINYINSRKKTFTQLCEEYGLDVKNVSNWISEHNFLSLNNEDRIKVYMEQCITKEKRLPLLCEQAGVNINTLNGYCNRHNLNNLNNSEKIRIYLENTTKIKWYAELRKLAKKHDISNNALSIWCRVNNKIFENPQEVIEAYLARKRDKRTVFINGKEISAIKAANKYGHSISKLRSYTIKHKCSYTEALAYYLDNSYINIFGELVVEED